MRVSVTLAIALGLGLSVPASGQQIGLFADPHGTSCDLHAAPNTQATWYFVYKPPLSLHNGSIRVTGLPSGFFTEAVPASIVISASGDPFADGLQFVLDACHGDPA